MKRAVHVKIQRSLIHKLVNLSTQKTGLFKNCVICGAFITVLHQAAPDIDHAKLINQTPNTPADRCKFHSNNNRSYSWSIGSNNIIKNLKMR